MASILGIAITDFTGVFSIPSGTYVDQNILDLIDQEEERILIDLLGWKLFDEFRTALAGTPAAKWTDLRDGDQYGTSPTLYNFKGVKQMIIYFVWYQYTRFLGASNTKVGIRVKDGTNSVENSSVKSMKLIRGYNEGIKIYHNAYCYIIDKGTYDDQIYTPKEEIGLL